MTVPKIQSSTDYETFAMLSGNRSLNQKKIIKIKEDVNKGLNLLPFCPIIVYEKDQKLLVVDGQHRFTVSKELDLPVYYVISDQLSLYQIAMMNSKQDKWKEADFLNCYLELENENYKTLKEFLYRYKAGYAVTVELLMYGKYGSKKDSLELFREGLFISNFPEEATNLLKLNHDLFSPYRFGTDRNLVFALQKLQEKKLCDFEHLKEKLKQAPMMMDKQSSYKEYIYNIERIYNHKMGTRTVIF